MEELGKTHRDVPYGWVLVVLTAWDKLKDRRIGSDQRRRGTTFLQQGSVYRQR